MIRFAAVALVLAGLVGVPATAHAATTPPAPKATTTATAAPKPAAPKPALRRTVLSRPEVSVAGYGAVWVSVWVKHQTTTGLKASVLSPVLVQRWTGCRWVTVKSMTTDGTYGYAVALVKLPGGRQLVRVVRPVGATVTAATSAAVSVAVPNPAGEGCGCELAPPA